MSKFLFAFVAEMQVGWEMFFILLYYLFVDNWIRIYRMREFAELCVG